MPVAVGVAPPSTFLVHATGCVTYEEGQRVIDQLLAMPGAAEARCLARMFSVFAEVFHLNVAAFRTSAEAEHWLEKHCDEPTEAPG